MAQRSLSCALLAHTYTFSVLSVSSRMGHFQQMTSGHTITMMLAHCYLLKSITHVGFPCGTAPSVGLSEWVMLCIHCYSSLSTRTTVLRDFCALPAYYPSPNHWPSVTSLPHLLFASGNFPLGRVQDGEEQENRTQVFNICIINSMGSFDGNWVLALGWKGLPNSRGMVLYAHIFP